MTGPHAPWSVGSIAEAAHLEMGQSPDGDATNTAGEGLPLIGGAADYKDGRIVASRFTTQPTKICREGDLILCIRATIGRVAVADKQYCLGRGVAGLRPSKVSADFLRYFLNSQQEAFDQAGTGTTFRQIDKKTLSSWPIPLPDPTEQRRIVAKLDALFTRSRSTRQELARIPRLVERYKQAVLAAAFRGELTAKWRERHPGGQLAGQDLFAHLISLHDRSANNAHKHGGNKCTDYDLSGAESLPSIPPSWTWAAVSILASKVTDGVHKKPNYVDDGIPFLTVRNLTAGLGISFYGCSYISESDHKDFIKRTHPEQGDILITKDGTLGVIRAIRTDRVFSIFVSLALIKPIDRSMTDYLELALTSPQVQQQMVGVGSGLQHIHLTDLRRDLIPIAPDAERSVIIQRVREAMEYIETVRVEANRALGLLDRLDQATLAKAFRGELVRDCTATSQQHAIEKTDNSDAY